MTTSEKLKRYLAGDVYYIRHIEAQQGPSSAAQPEKDLIEKKRAVLIRYQHLIECEGRISPYPAAVLLIYSFVFNIGLGVALNLGTSVSAGLSLIYTAMVANGFCLRFVYALRPLFQQLKLVSLEQPETRIQESNHREGGERGRDEGNALELDEIATARRTATMLLEEGETR